MSLCIEISLGRSFESNSRRRWKLMMRALGLAALIAMDYLANVGPPFATAKPVPPSAQELVLGVASPGRGVGTLGFDFAVTSGPSGENPGGEFALTNVFLGGRVDAAVACLRMFSA